jgi:hypothetical protein
MVSSHHRRAVGVFSTRQEAEHALNELKASGFPMDRVSIIAKDAERQDELGGAAMSNRVSSDQTDVGTATGAVAGTAVGTLGGLLVGLGSLAIPGVGPVIAAGTIGSTLATTLAGAGIGALTGGIVGALADLGIPEEQARVYGDRLSHGDYLVMVDGSDEEIRRAESIMHGRGIQHWGVYDTPRT